MALILVVDDEPDVRRLLAQVIARHGHQVVEAESSDAALTAMEREAAAVVFTDIQMPGHDGRWLTLELRKRYPATAVVLATSVSDLAPTVTMRFGVVSYLLKPFDLAAVAHALTMAVDWHAQVVTSGAAAVEARQLENWLSNLEVL